MMLLAAEATAASTPLWVTLVVGLAGATATGAVYVAGRIAQERNRRRDLYGRAVRAVIAWTEYPYQIRRRVSDAPQVLAQLVATGHQLQQDLAYFHTWLATDKPSLGNLYGDVVQNVKERCGESLEDAWAADPIMESSDMVLSGWGPEDCAPEIDRLQKGTAARFGWRRVVSAVKEFGQLWAARSRGHRPEPSGCPRFGRGSGEARRRAAHL